MGLTSEFASFEASRIMIDALTNRIREELRARILAKIEPDIQAAIDTSLEAFKTTIQSYRDHLHMRETVHVLIERRDLGERHDSQ